ncbi:hypothetical protein ACHAWU_002703 [Discostella pseudostelligera]|uniref:EF-hand domain-containing protein n=1 Tax=Discostella pseudostelligera TaxID=259834 RepID=A0ABD3MQE4_9STRA
MSPHSTTTNDCSLTERQVHEIESIFRAFNPSLSGFIDITTFERMCHSLGFRVHLSEIQNKIGDLRQQQQQPRIAGMMTEDESINSINERTKSHVDLSMAVQLLSQMGYAHRKVDDEMKIYFHLLDVDGKGFITHADLRRLQNEMNEIYRNSNDSVVEVVRDISLQAMIDQFDVNHNGVIDFDEFKNILSPILNASTEGKS